MGDAASSKKTETAVHPRPQSGRRAALITLLAALTSTYALGTSLIERHSAFLHAWADFGWLFMTAWAAVECWRARRDERTQRFASVALSAANVAWLLAMIWWCFYELVLHRISPFPTPADAGFIAYAPLYVVGIFFRAGGTRSLSLSMRHGGDLGIAVGTMLFSTLVIYYRPSVELGLPPSHIAIAIGYPVAFLSATAFGLLALLQRRAPSTRRVLKLHLGALALVAFAYTLYGVEILTGKYETGHVLDPFWFAGLALSIWAAREDQWAAKELDEDTSITEPTRLDAVLPAVACTVLALVIVTRRDDVRHVPAPLLGGTLLVFVASLALRGIAVMRLERELRRDVRERERELLKAQKMEAISTLAGGLAHDFNNLLTGIIAAASMLRRPRLSEEKVASYVDLIDQSALRASEITRRLMSLSRGRTEAVHGVVDIARAMRRVDSLLRSSISPAIVLSTSEVPEGAKIWGNEGEIEQILLNLGLNAANAMPNGGKLDVSVERRPRPRSDHGEPSRLVIRVRDEGCGIPESIRRKIFEPFVTTRAQGEGTGLGLAMVHALVKEHGGTIRFMPNEGRGTTFELELPETDREGPVSEVLPEANPLELPRGSETILVVDDRDTPLLAAKVILQAAGYEVLLATRAAEALDIWGRRRDIALLLADSIMPEMSGGELLNALREQRFEGPAILMTSYGEELERAPSPFDSRVPKPFAAGRLAQTVRRVLDESRRSPARREARGPGSAA